MANPSPPPLRDSEADAIALKVYEIFDTNRRTHRPPPALYHYTSSAGLKGIIESGIMRATHVAFMNDATEYLHAVDLFREKVVAARRRETDSLVLPLLDDMEANLIATDVSNMYVQFVACFSADDNSLSQWRAYGQGEGAFSIGFSSEGLEQGAAQNNALFCRVMYDRDEQSRAVQSLLDWALLEYPRRARAVPDEQQDKHRAEWLRKLFGLAAQVAPMIKNPRFKEEKEWRLIKTLSSLGSIGFVPKTSGLVPFAPLHLGKPQPRPVMPDPHLVDPLPDRLPITSICAGPGRFKEMSLLAARGLLQQCNYIGVNLAVSDIPYRVA